MIIRAWTEDGSPEPLRVQAKVTTNVSAGFERTLSSVGPEAVCALVEQWLAEVKNNARRPD